MGHWPITEVDLHLDYVFEHVLFSRLREAKILLFGPGWSVSHTAVVVVVIVDRPHPPHRLKHGLATRPER